MAGRVDVVFVDLAHSATLLAAEEAATPRLAPLDAARFANSGERRTAHIALRVALERVGGASLRGVEFSIDPDGRPFLSGGPHFSLSHSHGAALIAVAADQPIGVDLEWLRPLRISDSRRNRILSAAQGLGRGSGAPVTVLDAWVRLEAVAKLHGTGIGRLLTAKGVVGSKTASGGAEFPVDIDVQQVRVDDAYVAAIAAATLPAAITPVTMPSDASDLATFISGDGASTTAAK